MRTCDFTESGVYDATGELAQTCNRPSVGTCTECESDVCLGHGQMCACGKIFCESCRAQHHAGCPVHKTELFRKCAAPEHRHVQDVDGFRQG